MVLEIRHLVGWALFFLTVHRQQLLTMFTPAMLRPSLECHKNLGPVLFLLYVNDINSEITSQIRFFTDDSILYRNIRNQNYQVILQSYLDTFSLWFDKWLMEQNINKCSILSITIKRNYCIYDDNIDGIAHMRVSNHDYFDIAISIDLNWLMHIIFYIARLAVSLVYLKELYPLLTKREIYCPPNACSPPN